MKITIALVFIIIVSSCGKSITGKWLYEGHHYMDETFIPLDKKDSMYFEFAEYIKVSPDSITYLHLRQRIDPRLQLFVDRASYKIIGDSIEIIHDLDIDKTLHKWKYKVTADSLYFYSNDKNGHKRTVVDVYSRMD